MRKALATFCFGPAAALLEMSLPTFRAYAERHGYELIVGEQPCDRAAAWTKVPLLQDVLSTHDFALWIDADAIVLDASVDLETVVPQTAFQAFSMHRGRPELGDAAPNTGVWALRSGERANDFLRAIWAQQDLADHPYKEQAALMRIMGWTIDPPIRKERVSVWEDGTAYLDEEWNVIPMYPTGPVRIRHRAGWEQPLRAFDMRTDVAMINGERLRYWVGQVERRLLRPRGIRIDDRSLSRTPQALLRLMRRVTGSLGR